MGGGGGGGGGSADLVSLIYREGGRDDIYKNFIVTFSHL